MTDQLIRATAADGGIRAVGVVTTQLTEEARVRHHLSYVATAALGRSMAAGFLLASSMKYPQSRVNFRIRSSGPLGGLFVDAGLDGTVRGYVRNPQVELPLNAQGQLDVGKAIGAGYLYIMRDIGYGQPYTSTVELVTGEIGDDVAYYFANSEQTPSALALGVFSDAGGVSAAGGLLIQILPQATGNEPLIALLESRLSALQGFTPLLRSGLTLPQIMERILGDLDLQIFPESCLLRYHCPCSPERMFSALKMLGTDELQEMIETDQGAEVCCDFCGEKYQADVDRLTQLIQDIKA